MTYYVKTGEVHSGSDVYGIGDPLPGGIGDDAMVEAGAIEWRGEIESVPYTDLTKKQLLALCDERDIEVAGRPNNETLVSLLLADDDETDEDESSSSETDDEADESDDDETDESGE